MTHAHEPVHAAKDILGVEIARTGKFKLKTGELEVTARMLDDAARFANRAGARPGHLKIGHTDTRFLPGDGEPALGWLNNVRVEPDEETGEPVLKGDLTGMPDWLAAAAPSAWPYRSMEGYQNYVHEGQTYGLAVEGLALLGLEQPGMESLAALPAALGVAASRALEPSGTRIVASLGAAPKTPVAKAAGSPTKRTGAGMDPDQIREALGLEPDASDDQVRETFGTHFPSPASTPVAAAAGTRVVAESVWDDQQKTIKTLNEFIAKTKRDERDEVIAKAVQAGKFTPAQKGHFATMWDSNPDATRSLIEVMTPNSAFSVMASGYAGEATEQDELDREIDRLSAPRGKVA